MNGVAGYSFKKEIKMKNEKKNHQIDNVRTSAVEVFRALPIIAAIAAMGISPSALAVDRT